MSNREFFAAGKVINFINSIISKLTNIVKKY